MLTRIFIQNIALIEKLDVEFNAGFTVLTGETGAGKSILIDAVNLVLGERADRDLIGSHAPKALVEAVFSVCEPSVAASLDELGCVIEDGELFLSRELSASGKNTCRINGRLVTLSLLQDVSRLLVDVHGQHEHQSLLNPGEHMRLLDGFGAPELDPLKEAVRKSYAEIENLRARLSGGHGSTDEIERELDALQNQVNEIEAAKLVEGEELELEGESRLLENAEQITYALEAGYNALYGSDSGNAYESLRAAAASVSELVDIDDSFQELFSRVEDAYYAAEDLAFALRDKKSAVESDPYRLEEIQSRLDVIDKLGRKYGVGTKKILQYYFKATEKIRELEDYKAEAEQLRERMTKCEKKWLDCAQKLSRARKKAACALKDAIEGELLCLGMQSARFETSFAETNRISALGIDSVEFLLSTNRGETLKPLHKVASGGEMSRIMLALKTIGANIVGVETLIFDEIDAGISGRTAAVVGEKLLSISGSRQILCVTHQPQIAALADEHYAIEKEEIGQRTYTKLHKLDKPQKIMEIARLIGAENSSSGLEHAKEMIEKVAKIKRL